MEVYMNFMGEDFIANVDFDITSYGSPPHMGSLSYPGDPGDPPEFNITFIGLRRDTPKTTTPEFEATGMLFSCLCENDKILDAIYETIANDGPPEFDDNYF